MIHDDSDGSRDDMAEAKIPWDRCFTNVAGWREAKLGDSSALSMQIARTIEWSRCIDALRERGCRVFLELGPGTALSRMVRNRLGPVEARSVDEFRNSGAVAAWVQRSTDRVG